VRALAEFSAEAIQYAFREWRSTSAYFPAISNIRELCVTWRRLQREEREDAERLQRRAEVEQASERGELLEWPDVLKKFADICERVTVEKLADKTMPGEVPPNAEIVITQDRREMIRQQIEAIKARYGQEA